jgi:hypothetical protein
MTSVYAGDRIELLPLPDDRWRLVTDTVMGGVSSGQLLQEQRLGEPCVALRGRVSTENNGGFIQIAMDLAPSLASMAQDYEGLRLDVVGNGETYNVHLRTSDLWLPWQSYRASFDTAAEWRAVFLPFAEFEPYRTTGGLEIDKLRRIGVVAIGRDFDADLCVRGLAYYRSRD